MQTFPVVVNARARDVGASAFPEEIRDACGVGLLADLHGRPGRHVLPLALGALKRLAHRGAVDADGRTGDGAGVTTQIPFAVLRPELPGLGLGDCAQEDLAAGMVYLPRVEALAAKARRLIATSLASHGLAVGAWRDVPFDDGALGEKARRYRPGITHLLVVRPHGVTADDFEVRLFLARKEAEASAEAAGLVDFYIASLSRRTLVYKALVRGVDLADFYADLRHPDFETSFVMFHQRFSTNTLPSWSMAQPFRLLAHNGEINTIGGNRNWMRAREQGLAGFPLGDRSAVSLPVLTEGASDSASLDEALALLTAAGRGVAHGLTLLMPPAWEGNAEVEAPVRSMFDYQASQMEPWDGPALVLFTDGRVVGAALDRNGLRPARYMVTADGLLLVSSEVGVMDVAEDAVLTRGRLGPGDVVAVDLEAGRFLDRETLHRELAARHPYGEWVSAQRSTLAEVRASAGVSSQTDDTDDDACAADVQILRAFGYTREEQLLILTPMYKDGVEPLGSMGDDAPLAVLSARARHLFSYFKQRFAQVTNPPIDPLREALVMTLEARLGRSADLLTDGPLAGAQVLLADPVLDARDVEALLAWKREGWCARRLTMLFPTRGGAHAFEDALETLLDEAERAVSEGATCLILSDRGVDFDYAPVPSLLAVSAVHQHLVRSGLRLATSLVAETGEARDDHQVAALLGFGADAVSPYLVLDVVADAIRSEGGAAGDVQDAQRRFRKTLSKGLLKIMSKMGVSTLRSYHGAQLFEAVGISDDVIARHFTGTPSSIAGAGLADIAATVLERHRAAYAEAAAGLEEGGLHRYRRQDETHAFEPRVIKALHTAIKTGAKLDYKSYAELVHSREPVTLRDLMEFVPRTPIPLDMVEPVTAILPRFMSAAMSLGALSPEAQQVLSVAMNRMGARSNSGEGGEPAELFWRAAPGSERASNRIKQVASGRFGVTAAYLMSADEMQIKMAQGSKPGEGGQLPGHKVTAHIARVRHASQGTTLISPPPHHDIYSIEDLAQLIYDLKRVNPAATVSVKLVSSAGIGTIALGVAKAHADAIQISGHDGGTGASPRGSIKNAGTPWELGLSEAQQALQRGGLRGRVRLQVDGGLKTGRDVVMAALLGAEEFGFGTAPLVAAGCLMARQCHLNTCPAGIATQKEELRAKFTGTPEDIIRFFTSVAEEVREILALLGYRRLSDVIGRTDLLEVRLPVSGKGSSVSLGRMLDTPADAKGPPRWAGARNEPPLTGSRLDEAVLSRLRFGARGLASLDMTFSITNADRTVGARIAGELVRRQRGESARPGALRLRYYGSAGQSFGAFCVEGMSLTVEGEANDGVGKGMSGGEIVLRPPVGAHRARNQIIAGNTLLYGATGGHAFVAGCVGERVAVRNSGAHAVVEGTGDHACEYMTAGAVVILGPTGRNLGAGMSGGTVFVLDEEGVLERRYNPDWVVLEDEITEAEESWLRAAIARHVQVTGSVHAAKILADWSDMRLLFKRVAPPLAIRPVQALPSVEHVTPEIVKTAQDSATYTDVVAASA
jgi:glutamate synthase (ferredoxin)